MPLPTITTNAIMVGFCPLVPLPFVDELLRKVMMKGAYLSIGEQLGVALDPAVVEVLARGRGNPLLGCLGAAVWWPVRKFFKTFFYFLTVKECFDWAAEAALRGDMVREALARGLLPDKAEAVREAMDLAFSRHGGSPVTRALLRRRSDPVPWEGNALVKAGSNLVRYAGGHAVMAEFGELLDRVELGRPVVDPPVVLQ